MTFEEFQATRRWCEDLSAFAGYEDAGSGFAYAGGLHISANGSAEQPRDLVLVIGTALKRAGLEELERDLWQFGIDEGLLD